MYVLNMLVLNYIYMLSRKVWNAVLFPKSNIYSALWKQNEHTSINNR